MALSSIQISIEFKDIMKGEKNKGESFEDYIKRLRKQSIEDKSKSIDKEQVYRKVIVKPKIEFIETNYNKDLSTKEGRDVERKRLEKEHKNLPELPGKELTYDELPSEIGGVKIKP